MFRFFSTLPDLIDTSRIGELLKSNNHHYTFKELQTRGAIIAFTAVSSFLGSYLNDKNKTNCSNLSVALGVGTLAFALSHAIVIVPLIKKRYQMSNECQHTIHAIEVKLEALKDQYSEESKAIEKHFHELIIYINKLSLADSKRNNVSLTWGKRKRLLSAVLGMLEKNDFNLSFWQQVPKTICEQLENKEAGLSPKLT